MSRKRSAGGSARATATVTSAPAVPAATKVKGAVLEAAFMDAGLPLVRVGRVVEGTGLALA